MAPLRLKPWTLLGVHTARAFTLRVSVTVTSLGPDSRSSSHQTLDENTVQSLVTRYAFRRVFSIHFALIDAYPYRCISPCDLMDFVLAHGFAPGLLDIRLASFLLR